MTCNLLSPPFLSLSHQPPDAIWICNYMTKTVMHRLIGTYPVKKGETGLALRASPRFVRGHAKWGEDQMAMSRGGAAGGFRICRDFPLSHTKFRNSRRQSNNFRGATRTETSRTLAKPSGIGTRTAGKTQNTAKLQGQQKQKETPCGCIGILHLQMRKGVSRTFHLRLRLADYVHRRSGLAFCHHDILFCCVMYVCM